MTGPAADAGGAAAAIGARVALEVRRLLAPPVRSWRALGGAGPLTVLAGAAVVALHVAQIHHPALVDALSGVRAAEPLPLELTRLPGSLVAPAQHLPEWGAVGQVVLVFGLAERILGTRRALGLAALYHAASTLLGRVMTEAGPGGLFHLGVSQALAHTRDTGPSAAVVGLCVYLAVERRTPLLCGLLWAAMLAEFAFLPDLAGREHLLAMALGALTAIPTLLRRRADRPRGRGAARRATTAIQPQPGGEPLATTPTTGGFTCRTE